MKDKVLSGVLTLVVAIAAYAVPACALVTDAKAKTLASACADAVDPSNDGKTLQVTVAWKAVPSQSCGANLIFAGGSIQPATGATVTLTGAIEAPLMGIFDLSLGGMVTGFTTRTPFLYPQWWGATGTGTTDDAPAINAALAVIPTSPTLNTVYLPCGMYKVGSSITWPITSGVRLFGAGPCTNIVNQAAPSNPTILVGVSAQYFEIDHLLITGRAAFPNEAIRVSGPFGSIHHVDMQPNGVGIHLRATNTIKIDRVAYWPSGWSNTGTTLDPGNALHAILADGTYANDVHISSLNSVNYETIANGGAAVKWNTSGISQTITLQHSELEGVPGQQRATDFKNVHQVLVLGNFLENTDNRVEDSRYVHYVSNHGSGGATGTSYYFGNNTEYAMVQDSGAGGTFAATAGCGFCGAMNSVFDSGYSNLSPTPVTMNVKGAGSLLESTTLPSSTAAPLVIAVVKTSEMDGISGRIDIKATDVFLDDGQCLRWGATSGDCLLRRQASGAVNVGGGSTSSIQMLTGGGARLTLNNSGALQLNAYGAGTLVTDASGNVTPSSDARLKEIVGDFVRGLAAVQALHPVSYRWRASTGLDTKTAYSGFTAQNVQAAIPEAVGVMGNGDLTIQDRPIQAALVNAVKELTARVEALEKELRNKR